MPRTLQILAVFAALLLSSILPSCTGKDSHDKLAQDMIAEFEKFAEILESVKDVASAEKAARRLEALAPKFERLKERNNALEEPDAAEQKEFEEKYKERLDELGTKLVGLIMEMANKDPEAMKIIHAPFNKIDQSISELK